jgi:hypothetical protein
MDSCCQASTEKVTLPTQCPVCHQKGKSVQLITLKALLQPTALETIHPESSYAFCTNPVCEVVYFSDMQTFGKNILKVSVFQKDDKFNNWKTSYLCKNRITFHVGSITYCGS